jgi:hypothetical protein
MFTNGKQRVRPEKMRILEYFLGSLILSPTISTTAEKVSYKPFQTRQPTTILCTILTVKMEKASMESVHNLREKQAQI